jgi:hypothetical protein
MFWLTWRQFRASAAMMAAALAALAVILVLSGPDLADDYSSGIAACTESGDCSNFVDRFFQDNRGSGLAVTALVLVLPALIGLFWGAPLIARELEAGTHRLVWNQSITRTRWLAIKLGLVGLAAITVAGLGSFAVDWWSDPIDKASVAAAQGSRIEPLLFSARGIVPIGYAAFAFALGVTVGMLIRRTLPAMAITLAVFVALQIAMPQLSGPTSSRPPARTSRSPRRTSTTLACLRRTAYRCARRRPTPAPGYCPATPSTRPDTPSTPSLSRHPQGPAHHPSARRASDRE